MKLKHLLIGLHVPHPIVLFESRKWFARIYAVRLTEIFGSLKAIEITNQVNNQKDKELLLLNLNRIVELKKQAKILTLGVNFYPIRLNSIC